MPGNSTARYADRTGNSQFEEMLIFKEHKTWALCPSNKLGKCQGTQMRVIIITSYGMCHWVQSFATLLQMNCEVLAIKGAWAWAEGISFCLCKAMPEIPQPPRQGNDRHHHPKLTLEERRAEKGEEIINARSLPD